METSRPVRWHTTFSTYRRRPVFAGDLLRAACAAAMREASHRNGYRAYALAIMPDHVHIVHDNGRSGHGISKVMNNLKGVAARRVFEAVPSLKLDLASEHLWTTGYHSVFVNQREALVAACRYVVANPTKLGMAQQQYDWLTPLPYDDSI